MSWELQEEAEITSNDGILIQITSDKFVSLPTSQAIPQSVKSYSWEVEINKCSTNVDIGIGFKSDSNYVRYWRHTGNIENQKAFIEETEPSQANDIVSCHMRKMDYSGIEIQQCTFMKNEKKLGTWYVEGNNLRPTILFYPMNEETETVELKTSLGSTKLNPDHGKYA